MKKVMILGSGGMLGHMVFYYLKSLEKYDIVDASFPKKMNENSILLDVTDKYEVENFIKSENPDVIVNCIGILIQGSASDPSNAIYLNSFFPHQLSKILRITGGRLIHISTDCVYSGKKGEYAETDFRDADDIYGRSKALGEVINDTDVTLRTSIIGPELNEKGEGLFHWFMNQSGEINGYSKTFWGGVTTLELAQVIQFVIEQNFAGLVHVTNGERISKYNLLRLLQLVWKKDNIIVHEIDGKSSNKSLVKSNHFEYKVPSYETMINNLKEWMDKHETIYSL